jgi:hypothetical protein
MLVSSTTSKRRRLVLQPDSHTTWNPGVVYAAQDTKQRNKLEKITPHTDIYSLIAMAAGVDVAEEDSKNETSRTELDSHANMPVVGRHAYIISDTGTVADVIPFTPDYEIWIVDAAIQYDSPYDGAS